MRFLRRRVRQRKNRRWNTCIVKGCFQKTDHPDGPFCPDHGWKDVQ